MGVFPLDKTGISFMLSPIKSLNSLGEISPRPLKRVISEVVPRLFKARDFSASL